MSDSVNGLGRVVHLLPAGEAFQRGYRASVKVAVCGEVMTSAPDVDPSRYCTDCVYAAIQRTWDVGCVVVSGEC